MRGFLTTAPFPEYYFGTPAGQGFVTRFRNLPPTLRTNKTTGVVHCSTRQGSPIDDNQLYKANQTAGFSGKTEICLGFEDFTQFHQNGSNIDPYTMYTYDAVYAYALAADALLLKNATALSSSFLVEADSIFEHLTASTTSFDNFVTGAVSFLPGRGVRTTGNVYKILNYQAKMSYNEYSLGGLAFVGEYTDSSGWLLCGDLRMSANSQGQCNLPQYRTASGFSPPADAPPDIIEQLPSDLSTVLIVFATFGIVSTTIWAICLYYFWNVKLIRTSQPRIMSTLLIGAYLGLIKVYLSAFKVTHVSCVCQLWLSHFSFRFIFRTLLLKLWRIHAVMNAGSFKRVIILENAVLSYLLSDVLFMTLVLLMPITIISSLEGGLAGYVSKTLRNQTVRYAECQVRIILNHLKSS